MTQEEARAATRYRGRPCRKCGGTLRHTANRACVECESRRRHEAQQRHAGTTYIGKVCPHHFELKGLRRVKRGGVCVGCNRERMKSESFVATVERWRESNPELYRSAHHARQAAKRARKADAADDRTTRLAFARLSRRAKRLGMDIDHATPMNGCRVCGAQGKHEPSNWQLLTGRENSAKGNRCMKCWTKA